MEDHQALCSGFVPARKPTIATQMHSDRERERERQSSSGSGTNSNNANNVGNSSSNNNNNSGNTSSNASGPVSSNHHQSRKEEQTTVPVPQPPLPSDSTAAATIYHPRLPPFPSPAAPIGPSLGATSICSVSSTIIPPPLGSTLPPLNLGPPPAISSAAIGPPPLPSISSLTPGVIGPPPPPALSLGMPLPPIISIPSLHLPPVPSNTIHSSQHTATIISSAATTITTSIYHQQQHLSSSQQQHHQRASTSGTTTTNSQSNAMTTHIPTPPSSSSSTLNTINQMTHKSPPLSHNVHIPRNKEPTTTTITTGSSLSTTAIVTTTTNTTTTSQPAFVRPFEDSFRSSTKTQQRPIMNSHNHSIANQISHHESPLKSSSMTPTSSQTVGNQMIQENPTIDNNIKSNQTLSQPVPYSPQFHHPHIPISHVPSLYKPPHFSSSSSHQQHQHHSQPKLNIPTINTSSTHVSNSGTSTNCTKQQNTHHVGESHQTTATTQRNENTANGVSNEKTTGNTNLNANNQITNSSKITNHTNAHHKSNLDVASKDKSNTFNEKNLSENQSKQQQLLNQNHVITNSVQEKAPISHLSYEQGKNLPAFHPINLNLGEKEYKGETDCKAHVNQNNTLSTLPFQSNFKFSISDIAQKPMDATHLMQSIKSEEVLRTCQNVSNVLLQIPKYQEKLLNFSSNNELKTAFCFTDKCNNVTEISVKCEPAVLNVPDLSKTLVKQDTIKEKSFLVPEKPKELTSSLDLAEKRRKRKRDKNTAITCSSDSEAEEDIKDIDLWITKGPPAKLQYSQEKLTFLSMFGLTTLDIRNGKQIT